MEVSKNGRVSKVPARSAFTIQPIPGAVVADNNRHMAIWFESGDKEAGAWEGWCEESGSMGVDAVLEEGIKACRGNVGNSRQFVAQGPCNNLQAHVVAGEQPEAKDSRDKVPMTARVDGVCGIPNRAMRRVHRADALGFAPQQEIWSTQVLVAKEHVESM